MYEYIYFEELDYSKIYMTKHNKRRAENDHTTHNLCELKAETNTLSLKPEVHLISFWSNFNLQL